MSLTNLTKQSVRTDAQCDALEELHQQFRLPTAELKKMSNYLVEEMRDGLKTHNATVPMLPSFIKHHPTGQEQGEYLALELSGSYVRTFLVHLHGKGRITTRQQKYRITDNLKKGSITNLIDFLARCVDSFLIFVGKQDIEEPLALGFSISFPLNQTAINQASVRRWTKDFEITGADDKNLSDLLQESLKKRKVPVVVKAVLNGTAGCLLAHNYRSLDTLLACTVSTGTNAAYWEKTVKVVKYDIKGAKEDDEMIMDTEWGSFGDSHPHYLPRTFYDNTVNRESINPGIHLFEKMISGLYLGEIVRCIMVDFLDRRLIFNGQYTKELNTPYFFEVSYMSAIEMDTSEDLEDTKHILETILNIPTTTLVDRQMVKRFCGLVGQRAARLTAAAMSAVIDKRNVLETGLTVSVEGSIYEHYPSFPERVNKGIREIYGANVDRINIGVTRDGNGIGAALAAMIACTRE
ncbi:hexokinase-domain-containing protein [Phycomyces nitens]|nr:hexokinase-domain-containing protein [Phycomyces nitens]